MSLWLRQCEAQYNLGFSISVDLAIKRNLFQFNFDEQSGVRYYRQIIKLCKSIYPYPVYGDLLISINLYSKIN